MVEQAMPILAEGQYPIFPRFIGKDMNSKQRKSAGPWLDQFEKRLRKMT